MLERVINPPKAFFFVYTEKGPVLWAMVTHPLAIHWYTFWFGLRTLVAFYPSRICCDTYTGRERFWTANRVRNMFRRNPEKIRQYLNDNFQRIRSSANR